MRRVNGVSKEGLLCIDVVVAKLDTRLSFFLSLSIKSLIIEGVKERKKNHSYDHFLLIDAENK